MEEIAEKEAAAEDTVENDKQKVDNANAVEMRNRGLESLGGTQKRQRNVEQEDVKSKQKSYLWTKREKNRFFDLCRFMFAN